MASVDAATEFPSYQFRLGTLMVTVEADTRVAGKKVRPSEIQSWLEDEDESKRHPLNIAIHEWRERGGTERSWIGWCMYVTEALVSTPGRPEDEYTDRLAPRTS